MAYDGLSEEELVAKYGGTLNANQEAALAAKMGAQLPGQEDMNPATQGSRLTIGPFTTPIPTSPLVDQILSGMGAGLSDLALGVKERFGAASPQDVENKRISDAALNSTTAGKIGNMAGQALPALATLPFAAMATIPGAALTGAALGAAQPTGQDEGAMGALANTAFGAAGGALGQAGANLVGRAIAPIRSALNPEQMRLAGVAADNGINLDLAQRTGSKPLGIINSVLDNLPITSGIEEAKRATQQTAFNRAILAKGGVSADLATPEAVRGGLGTAGKTIEDVAKRNSVNIDGPLLKDLFSVYDEYSKVLEPNQRAIIGDNLNAILNQRGILPGETYQKTRSTLGKLMASKDPNLVQAAKGIRDALDSAAARSINPEDLASFNTARQNYAVMKDVSRAVQGPGGVSGNIPPAAFRQAVSSANPTNYAKGIGPVNDLARAGYQFLREPIGNSGTAQRMLYQGLLQGGIAGALGGGAYAGSGGDMTKTLTAAGGGLLGPLAVQRMLANPAVSGYLLAGPGRKLLADQTSRALGPLLTGAGAVAIRP